MHSKLQAIVYKFPSHLRVENLYLIIYCQFFLPENKKAILIQQ